MLFSSSVIVLSISLISVLNSSKLIVPDLSVSKWTTISFASSLEGGFAPISVDIVYNILYNSSELICP